MAWDVGKAVKHLHDKAKPQSTGHCAQFVREAIEAGGVTLLRHNSAKDYGTSLTAVGVTAVSTRGGYIHKAGDVGIVQPIPGHPHGHMAMFDGRHWISDFVQYHGLYPGKSYRAAKPPYAIYRNMFVWAGPDKAGRFAGVA
jgi:hypothetical protein